MRVTEIDVGPIGGDRERQRERGGGDESDVTIAPASRKAYRDCSRPTYFVLGPLRGAAQVLTGHDLPAGFTKEAKI